MRWSSERCIFALRSMTHLAGTQSSQPCYSDGVIPKTIYEEIAGHLTSGTDLGLQRARLQLRKQLTARPYDAQLHDLHARLLDRTGQPGNALSAARTAVTLDPQNVTFLHNLGVFLAKTGHLAEAVTTFDRVVTQQPDDEEALGHLLAAL